MYLNEKIYREGNDKVKWKKSHWSSPVNYVGRWLQYFRFSLQNLHP